MKRNRILFVIGFLFGEDISNLSEDFKKKHDEIAWRDIKGMRNILLHEYWNRDSTIIYNSVKKNIKEDVQDLKKIYEEEFGD